MKQLDPERIVTVDFETYFSKEYSLRSKTYNTSEYIRDPQFKVQCVAIKKGSAPSVWYPGAQAAQALGEIDWSKSYLLAHNTAFDGLILTEHFGHTPYKYLDTMSMARALLSNHIGAGLDEVAAYFGAGNKLPNVLNQTKGIRDLPEDLLTALGEYCTQDVKLCHAIFTQLVKHFPVEELELIHITLRMFCEPILRVDRKLVRQELRREQDLKRALVALCGCNASDLQSADSLAARLRSLGLEPPTKISARTGERAYAFASTDAAFTDLRAHPDERVRHLVEARLAVKSTIGETRAARFLNASARGKRLPVMLNYARAHTFRWSGGNKLNMQNLPRIDKDDPNSGLLRRAIMAPPGHVIVVADSSQIEARTNAWNAGETKLLAAFAEERDPYREFAATVYKITTDMVSKAQRFVGKISILGLGYQMGAPKFQYTLALGLMGPPLFLEIEECEEIVRTYRRTYPAIVRAWTRAQITLQRMLSMRHGDHLEWGPLVIEREKVWLPNGLALQYPGLSFAASNEHSDFQQITYQSNDRTVKIYGGLFIENLIQALARVIVGDQMRIIAERYRVVMMTHDEVACVVPKKQADEALEYMLAVMSTPPAWAPDLPLAAEGGYAVRYLK